MAVAIVPAAPIPHVYDITAGPDRMVVVQSLQQLTARRHHGALGGRHDRDEPFRAANIQAVVVVDLRVLWLLAAIHVDRFVGHLGQCREPPLLGRIAERAGSHPGRWIGPDPQSHVLVQRPHVALRRAGQVTAGDRAIQLDAADACGQVVVGRRELGWFAIDLDRHNCLTHRLPHHVAMFQQAEHFHVRLRAVTERDTLRLAHVQINRANQRVEGFGSLCAQWRSDDRRENQSENQSDQCRSSRGSCVARWMCLASHWKLRLHEGGRIQIARLPNDGAQ